MTAWAEDESGNLLGGVLAYKEGWLDLHPESKGLSGSRRKATGARTVGVNRG